MDIFECPVCADRFDEQTHRPLLLPACGHTLCRGCTHQVKGVCPICRAIIGAAPAALPTNILALRAAEASGSPLQELIGGLGGVAVINGGGVELLHRVSSSRGSSGGGEVWAAHYDDRKVAVKIFDAPLPTAALTGSPPAALGAFIREVGIASLATQETHYCVRLIGITVKDSRPAIVTKWYPAGKLTIPEGGFDLPAALTWGAGVLKALVEVHSLGIVVSDLNPESILISETQDPILADFGLSRRIKQTLGDHMAPETVDITQGTLNYMAPEQYKSSGLTNKADIWSFGCLMVQLLTGRAPWHGLSIAQVANLVLVEKATPPLPPNLPDGLAALLQRCFDQEPANRPSAAELLEEMRANNSAWAISTLGPAKAPATPEMRPSANQQRCSTLSEDGSLSGVLTSLLVERPRSRSPTPPPLAGTFAPAAAAAAGSAAAESVAEAAAVASEAHSGGAGSEAAVSDGAQSEAAHAEGAEPETAHSGGAESEADSAAADWVDMMRLQARPSTSRQGLLHRLFGRCFNPGGGCNEEEESTGSCVPRYLEMLLSDNEADLREGAQGLWGATSDDGEPGATSRVYYAPGGVFPLMHILGTTEDVETLRAITATLGNVAAEVKESLDDIIDVTPLLVKRLDHDDTHVRRFCIGILESIADMPTNDGKAAVLGAGALVPCINLLTSSDEPTLRRAAGLLWSLTLGDGDHIEGVVDVILERGIDRLVALLSFPSHEVQGCTAAVVCTVAGSSLRANQCLCVAGAVPPLVAMLADRESCITTVALHSVCILCHNPMGVRRARAAGVLRPMVRLLAGDANRHRFITGALERITYYDETAAAELVSLELLPTLAAVLASDEALVVANAIGTFFNISTTNDANCAAIRDCGAVYPLVDLLGRPTLSDSARIEAAGTLSNVTYSEPRTAADIRAAGGIPRLLALVGPCVDPRVQAAAMAALEKIADEDEPSRPAIVEAGGLGPILAVMSRSDDAEAVRRATGALWDLSLVSPGINLRHEICEAIQGAAIPTLIKLLEHEDTDVRRRAAATLGNLASTVPQQIASAGGVRPLVALLNEAESIPRFAAGALAVLAEEGGTCRHAVVDAGAEAPLRRLAMKRGGDEEAQRRAKAALDSLAS